MSHRFSSIGNSFLIAAQDRWGFDQIFIAQRTYATMKRSRNFQIRLYPYEASWRVDLRLSSNVIGGLVNDRHIMFQGTIFSMLTCLVHLLVRTIGRSSRRFDAANGKQLLEPLGVGHDTLRYLDKYRCGLILTSGLTTVNSTMWNVDPDPALCLLLP